MQHETKRHHGRVDRLRELEREIRPNLNRPLPCLEEEMKVPIFTPSLLAALRKWTHAYARYVRNGGKPTAMQDELYVASVRALYEEGIL